MTRAEPACGPRDYSVSFGFLYYTCRIGLRWVHLAKRKDHTNEYLFFFLLFHLEATIITVIILLFCILCVFLWHRSLGLLLSKGGHGISECAAIVRTVHTKVRQALMNLHRCWLGGKNKQASTLSRPGVKSSPLDIHSNVLANRPPSLNTNI